jgi:hypothetical protein
MMEWEERGYFLGKQNLEIPMGINLMELRGCLNMTQNRDTIFQFIVELVEDRDDTELLSMLKKHFG